MTSRVTGIGILVTRALTSKDTKVSSVATFCSFGDWVYAFCLWQMGKLVPQHSQKILVGNLANL